MRCWVLKIFEYAFQGTLHSFIGCVIGDFDTEESAVSRGYRIDQHHAPIGKICIIFVIGIFFTSQSDGDLLLSDFRNHPFHAGVGLRLCLSCRMGINSD